METDLLFLRDAYSRTCGATVLAITDEGVVLDRTVLYPTGGGQPHDTGSLAWAGGTASVVGVHKAGGGVVHVVEGNQRPPEGAEVQVHVDWDRRHDLMRTHTALHILCGVIWNEWGTAVTGGNMERLKARMDFAFDPLPVGFAERVADLVNAEISVGRPIEVSFLPRETAVVDADLIRTKVNLIPEAVTSIRVVDIVGLDKQADGGTHVANTSEVGHFQITKTESKGKGNKRVRMELS
jgi:misacylated tRNA(Ala) deacylase